MSMRIKLESQAAKNEAGVELESSREVRVWWKKMAKPGLRVKNMPRFRYRHQKMVFLVADTARCISPYTSIYTAENMCHIWRVSVYGDRSVKGHTVVF